ncbi:hypothetical protein BST22_01320 [Mycolicibacterium chubuense]|uniref:DUF3566 domain-containing protein n=1 Tax=Mycolicibacterium chubuense TaxID=1800 RepID=A0A0J6VTB5_MYCCU|nr:DUF3566 domain-containing protein [Mycolicibacterium chubuense]KMO73424.1 hypothetical protein MCHUDSM44219_04602 [Mycolicibacterium chubuense]ORA56601.1 hypothetical protein BST22_01320 [Mycolicibacterium chubuense]SPX98958.1 putative integral membrane protein [Mycolicibacterium chubuense]
MSSPNEPGHPRAGEASGATGNGSPAAPAPVPSGVPPQGPAHGAEHADVPPWQRGPAARARQQQAPDAQGGLDARLNRFISGGQDTESTPRGDRTEVLRPEGTRPEGTRPEGNRPEPPTRTEAHRPEPPTRTENTGGAAYKSELPDLSGPPRTTQQRKPAERQTSEPPARPAQKAAGGRAVQVGPRQHTGPVRASMQIRRVDPWSALKVSLVLSVALFFVWMIAVAFLYLVLGGMGVWSKLNSNVGDLLTSASGSSGGELVSSGTIFGGAALIGLVNIVLLTAAATIGAFIYNLTTDLVGGVEVTLADRD